MTRTLEQIDLFISITEKHLSTSLGRSQDTDNDRVKDFNDGLTMGHETSLRYLAEIRKRIVEEIKEKEGLYTS